MSRFRRASTWAALAAMAFLLTGCLKLNIDLDVASDDTVSGSVVFAFSKELLDLMGGSPEDLTGDAPFPSDAPGVTVEDYDDGEFVGQEFRFDAMPLEEFNSSEDPEGLQIERDGDVFRVSGVLDLSSGAEGTEDIPGLEDAFANADLRVSLTFPGEITETNGQVDGNTVTWTPKVGERLEIRAVAGATGDGGGASTWIVWALVAAGVIVVGVIVALVMRSRSARAPAEAAGAPEPTQPLEPPAAPTEPVTRVEPAAPTEPVPPVPPPTAAPVPEDETPPEDEVPPGGGTPTPGSGTPS